MTKREIIQLQKTILPQLPEFQQINDLLYIPPKAPLLRAIGFDRSGFSKTTFFPTVFVLPLFVPLRQRLLGVAQRLRVPGGTEAWTSTDPDLESKLVRVFRTEAILFVGTLGSMPNFIDYLTGKPWNQHANVWRAFALAYEGRNGEAADAINSSLQTLANSEWAKDLTNGLLRLENAMSRGREETMELLHETEKDTIKNLKLA